MHTCIISIIILSWAYNILFDSDVGAPGHGKYVVDGLNASNKRFLKILMTNVQLTSDDTNNSQMFMHITISNKDMSITRVFQKIYFRLNTFT